MSFIYHSHTNNIEKSFNIIASSQHVYTTWYNAISILLNGIKIEAESTSMMVRYIKFMFEYADDNHDGKLTKQEVKSSYHLLL
jgi:hypothetical protein